MLVFQLRPSPAKQSDGHRRGHARERLERPGASSATSRVEESAHVRHGAGCRCVQLDRQLGTLDAERLQQRGPSSYGSIAGSGSSIRPDTIRACSRSRWTGRSPAGLEPDRLHLQGTRARRGSEARVPRERHLVGGCEDPIRTWPAGWSPPSAVARRLALAPPARSISEHGLAEADLPSRAAGAGPRGCRGRR